MTASKSENTSNSASTETGQSESVQNFHSITTDLEDKGESAEATADPAEIITTVLTTPQDTATEEAMQDNSNNENAENKAIDEAMETENSAEKTDKQSDTESEPMEHE